MSIDYSRKLNKEQLEAATTTEGPMLILAGAGSGKTTTLVHRVAYLVEHGADPERILLLTFTNKAAKEMKERSAKILEEAGIGCDIEASTFHSFCARKLRRYGDRAGIGRDFTVISPEDEAEAVNIIKTEMGIHTVKGMPRSSDIVGYISMAVNKGTSLSANVPDKYQSWIEEIEGIAKRLKDYKLENGYADYDDLMLYFKGLLEKDGWVQEQVERQYQYIMVDEYQDTNSIQDEILFLMRRGNHNIAVVGDDMQSIYAFRGAEVQNIIQFPEKMPGCRIVTLDKNYRSCQEILDLANHVTEHATEGYKKILTGTHYSGIMPVIRTVPDQDAEALFVLDLVRQMHEEGKPYRDICIIARASSSFMRVEMGLTRNGIPYEKRGGLKFMDKAHIRDILAFLQVMQNPRDELSWFRLLKVFEGVGPVYSREIAARCKMSGLPGLYDEAMAHKKRKYSGGILELYSKMQELSRMEFYESLPELCSYYIEKCRDALIHMVTNDEAGRAEKLEKLDHEVAGDLGVLKEVASDYKTLHSFLDDIMLDNSSAAPQPGTDDALVLSTVHSVKGLEYDTVAIMDAVDGMFPSAHAEPGTKEDNEELRCFYVAVTRAKEHLYFLCPEYINRYGKPLYGEPSRYLN